MNLFKPSIESDTVGRPWLWTVGFALLPWTLVLAIGFALHHILPLTTDMQLRWLVGVLVFCLVVLAVLIYEQWFGVLAQAILKKNYRPELDDPHYERIYPSPTDRAAADALKAARAAPPEHKPAKEAAARAAIDAAATRYAAEADEELTLPGVLGAVAVAAEWFATAGDKRYTHIKYVLDRLQSRINEEYTDISSRTGWLMSGQAFLLGAFVAVLNADRLSEEVRHWLATGVAFSGAVISFVLALSTFFGHALIVKLKTPRDDAEKIMATEFHVPRAGVPAQDSAHQVGHAATRFLPSFAYVAWACLTLLALTGHLSQRAPDAAPPTVQMLPYEAMTRPEFTRGWSLYATPTPPFPIGATAYVEPDKACPDNARAADEWVDSFIAAWAKRPLPSANDGLVLVGSADRINLSEVFKRRFDSNMSLARGRAEEIKRRLIAKTQALASQGKLGPQHRISDGQVMVLVTGPRNADPVMSTYARRQDCKDTALAADRTVQVWMPAGE